MNPLVAFILALLGTILMAAALVPGVPDPLFRAGALLVGIAVCLLTVPH